jgi:uncharacterized protein
MALSKHNIIVPVEGSEEYFIVNPLHKSADFISEVELKKLESEIDDDGVFADRGYLIDPDKEKKIFKFSYLDFMEERDKDEVQLFFVPNYSCNFACSYCYQEGYEPAGSKLTNYVIDLFFGYIGQYFDDRKKYVTVFGGEPLLPGKHQHKLMEYFVDLSLEKGIELAFVTNGFTLVDYIDLLKRAKIREIQVTLDGTAEIHDNRRYLYGHKPTFDKIVAGIDACLEAGIPINLRVVADKDNIGNLPRLADFAISKGWTKSPLFKTQIGRNYELHVCNSAPDKLFDRAELYRKIYDLLGEYPQIAEFYRPAFSIARYIADTGQMPMPLFDSCPACKTEWAFDFTGNIYSCTATVGKKGEELGTFYPLVTTNDPAIAAWQNRDITTIEKCKNCEVALACGGGCASVAKNKFGHVNAPDCRPVKELLSLGAAYYF